MSTARLPAGHAQQSPVAPAPQAAHNAGTQPLTEQGLDNLEAMTRLLGYVRFFHPIQGHELVNWDAMAIEGARSAETAGNAADLAERLEAWIRQAAPTVRVCAASAESVQQAIEQGEAGDLIDPRLRQRPPDRSVKVIHWMHHGINLSQNPGPYFSKLDAEWLKADEHPSSDADPARPMVLDLGAGVCAVIPRFIYEVPPDPRDAPKTKQPANASAHDRAVRFAAVALTWTVMQHFFPYFDVIDTNWDAELTRALRSAATDSEEAEFLETLRRMIAALKDGHGGVYSQRDANWFVPPLTVDRIEGEWIVTSTRVPSVEAGDRIRSIDGEPIDAVVEHLAGTISAAHDGWMRYRAAQTLLAGPVNAHLFVEIESPNGGGKSVRLTRSVHASQMREPRPNHIEEVEAGVWYVDLDRVTEQQVQDVMPKLANARGVVFDMRGYPSGISTIVISHLIDEPVTCAQWHIPVVTKPDRESMTFQFSNWPVQPRQPRITGSVAFIIDGRAISYAETYMGIIEHYRLAEIVGEPTAGTNGNVSAFALPGGYNVAFTGMKVLKHDGSQHHGIGILPTVPCSRTIEGVRAGRDELLERAIEVVKGAD